MCFKVVNSYRTVFMGAVLILFGSCWYNLLFCCFNRSRQSDVMDSDGQECRIGGELEWQLIQIVAKIPNIVQNIGKPS